MEHRLSALLQPHLHFLLNTWQRLGKDKCKTRRESFKFWDLVHLILEILRLYEDCLMRYGYFHYKGKMELDPLLVRWDLYTESISCYTCAVECCYNLFQYGIILHTALQKLRQNIIQSLCSQKTHLCVSYGVSVVRILEKSDHVIIALHCICVSEVGHYCLTKCIISLSVTHQATTWANAGSLSHWTLGNKLRQKFGSKYKFFPTKSVFRNDTGTNVLNLSV